MQNLSIIPNNILDLKPGIEGKSSPLVSLWEAQVPKMTAAAAAVLILELEGVGTAFGVPGAAINPSLPPQGGPI
jgi:hypothetical protein